MATRMPATQLRGLLVDDAGNEYRQEEGIFGPSHTKKFGEDLMQGRRDRAADNFWNASRVSANGTRFDAEGKPLGFLQPSRVALNPEWDAFHGIMAGVKNAAESQGRNMAVSGMASRPSMRAIASGTYAQPQMAAADGWEPPEVRAAKLRILQEQGNAMTDARLQNDRELDPNYQDYMGQRGDERAIASFDRRAPMFRAGRAMDREEDSADFNARAYDQGTNPWVQQEKERQDRLLRERNSMDALARMFGSMRPETAELFENNPGMLDEFGRRVGGQQPAPRGSDTGVRDEAPAQGAQAASPAYAPGVADGTVPPVVRAEIEQWLRENRHAVNDRNVNLAYQRLQQQR